MLRECNFRNLKRKQFKEKQAVWFFRFFFFLIPFIKGISDSIPMRVKNQKMEQHCPSSVLLPCCHPQEPYRTIPLLLMSTQNIGGLQEEPPIEVPNPISQICCKDKHKRVSPFPAWKQTFTNPQFCPHSPAP